MQSVDEIWRQVVETPDDLGLRLVLADALLDQGDPRGELIALQCRGADARVVVDREVDAENVAERVNELVATNWDTWLGELAEIVIRQGSTYVDGMLSSVQVGDTNASVATWERAAKHRELCAVKRVKPVKARSEQYGSFLAALVHDPQWVDIPAPHVIRVVRAKRKQWAIREIRYGGMAYWRDEQLRGLLTSEMQMLSELARDLEIVHLSASWLGEEVVGVIFAMPRLFPKLRALRLEDRFNSWRRDMNPAVLAQIEAMPQVVFVDDDD